MEAEGTSPKKQYTGVKRIGNKEISGYIKDTYVKIYKLLLMWKRLEKGEI